jgi:hypothetical protein
LFSAAANTTLVNFNLQLFVMEEPIWNATTGYGDREGRRHSMVTQENEQLVVNYAYSGEDQLHFNPAFMPLSSAVVSAMSPEFEDQCRIYTFRTGMLSFQIETPTLYALIYSKMGAPTTLNTFFVLLGYERLLNIARAKVARNMEKEHIQDAFAILQVERENLVDALFKTINKFGPIDCEDAENAIVAVLIPFTTTYIAIVERCCWRIYGQFTEAALAARLRTIPVESGEKESGVYCALMWKGMCKKWADIYEKIPLENTFDIDEESFTTSRYIHGVNVTHAKFLFDFYRQESLIEIAEVKN